MKKIYSLLATILLAATATAQNTTTYFMKGATTRSDFNPALAPTRGYVNLPGIGAVQATLSSPVSLDHCIYKRNNKWVTMLDTSVSSGEALRDLSAHNILQADLRVELLGFGAFTKNGKNFWSFGLNLRSDGEADVPYSFFEFFKTGRESTIRNLRAEASAFAEAAFSYSRPINERLYIGARVKLLAGLARAKVNIERMDVKLLEDRWEIDTRGIFEMAGPSVETDEKGNFTFRDIDMDRYRLAGMGASVDLGATYDIRPDLQVSLGITDLGFIAWNKGSATRGESSKELKYTGVEVIDGKTAAAPDFDFDLFEFRARPGKETTRMLKSTVNAGVEYDLWEKRVGLGLLYSARFNSIRVRHSLTGSVNFYPAHWVNLTASYLCAGSRGSSVGLALNLFPGAVNLLLATDIITAKVSPQFIPVKRKTANFTFGLGFPIGRFSTRDFDRVGPVNPKYEINREIKREIKKNERARRAQQRKAR